MTLSLDFNPFTVVMTTGKNVNKTTTTILEEIPVPNQTTIKGAKVKIGIIWDAITKGKTALFMIDEQEIAIDNEKANIRETVKPKRISLTVTWECFNNSVELFNNSTIIWLGAGNSQSGISRIFTEISHKKNPNKKSINVGNQSLNKFNLNLSQVLVIPKFVYESINRVH